MCLAIWGFLGARTCSFDPGFRPGKRNPFRLSCGDTDRGITILVDGASVIQPQQNENTHTTTTKVCALRDVLTWYYSLQMQCRALAVAGPYGRTYRNPGSSITLQQRPLFPVELAKDLPPFSILREVVIVEFSLAMMIMILTRGDFISLA